ncbi:MAG: ATP-binding protein [Paludibacteraceae bacterium]|nr:ATP-binding protein [Paludibacteraceae bacterium]
MFPRRRYLEMLINHRHNGMIKTITGARRCGKSVLLFTLFRNWLQDNGVNDDHIIAFELDDRRQKRFRDPDVCLEYITQRIKDDDMYYLLIDEVQMMDEFEDVLNSCLHISNLDTYVTGSNSKFLSSDIITEFRGRGDEIRIFPLSFSEFAEAFPDKSWERAWSEYSTYGGLPRVLLYESEKDKKQYLSTLWRKTYTRDIVERYKIQNTTELDQLIGFVASSIGSLTNPHKLANTFTSKGSKLSEVTISQYLSYLEDAFLIEKAERYDIRGKQYLSTPYKYYFVDLGLRNIKIGMRQYEETHIMENVIYNELVRRGYSVDVGVVEIRQKNDKGDYARVQTEVDFVVNLASERYYIQSAFALPTKEKQEQEERPLRHIDDSFKKIIIVKEDILLRRNEAGIVTMGLREFLTNENSLNL